MKRSRTSDACEAGRLLLEWAADPDLFVREALGAEPESWQTAALRAVAQHDRIAIRSGHGVGKSALLAWLVLWFLMTRAPCKLPCTAPTAHQLQDILWGEIAKWSRRLRERHPVLADLVQVKSDRVELKEAAAEAFAVARTARKETPEAFQGFHSENLLFIVDEASGVDDAIFEVGEGAMSTPGAKTVLTGNPTRTSGYFYDAFHRGRAAWTTLKVPCADSRLVSRAYAAGMASRYGSESNIYRVRVMGEFPTSEDDAVIPLAWCEAAVGRDVQPIPGFRVVWGLDVARFGSDRTALAKRRANVLLEPVKAWHGLDTMQVCGVIVHEYETAGDADDTALDRNREPTLPGEILVDSIGLGAGVVDRLRELGLPARGVNVAEASAIDTRHNRHRDELWWRAREWFQARDGAMPDDPALIAELSLPKYRFTSAGKIQVESKDDLKSRGVQSPDLADAFCLTFAGGVMKLERHISTRYTRRRRKREGSWMAV